MGAYQIRFLERVPKRAVVDDAVELTKAARKRSAAGLVNAVLRKCEPPKDRVLGRDFEHLSAENRESVRRAFPAWLLKRWEGITATTTESGEVGAVRLAYASLQTPRTTLRVVDAGANLQDIRQELEAEGVATSSCQYAEAHGLTVESGQVQNTRAYREGRVVIQDEASQLVAELVSPEPGQRVLDLCAAPGMKAGQLAQMLGAGTLVACDRSAARLRTLAKLLPQWVPAAVRLSMVRLDAAHALPFGAKFDRILLDAPCSGTGTLARNPEIKWRLRPEDITRLAELQAMMLRNALPALANGGRLVYATCSLEPEENEGVVEKVLSEAARISSPYFARTCPEASAPDSPVRFARIFSDPPRSTRDGRIQRRGDCPAGKRIAPRPIGTVGNRGLIFSREIADNRSGGVCAARSIVRRLRRGGVAPPRPGCLLPPITEVGKCARPDRLSARLRRGGVAPPHPGARFRR